jgi:hypothetical protein
MLKTQSDLRAIIRGEQRSTRFQYRHTIAGAAREIGIPSGWVWWWFHTDRLRFRSGLRCVFVRVEDVRRLFGKLEAIYDAFYATREPLSCPAAIKQALGRWPELPEQMYVPEAPKRPVTRVISFRAAEDAS